MATISLNIDFSQVVSLKDAVTKLKDPEYLLRPVCLGLIDKMKFRIHDEGQNSSQAQIGTYNPGYLLYRQRKHQRDNSKKIIVSLTRQLENDWKVIPNPPKSYGIGFANPFNLQKARWVEEIKGVAGKPMPIFDLSPDEEKYTEELFNQLIDEALK